MKKLTKSLIALAITIVLLFAMAACTQDETDKYFTDIKKSYESAGYKVTSINKSNDLVKDKETYLTDVEEIYSVTKDATEGNTGESYLLFKFKEASKAEALKTAYSGQPKTAIEGRLLLVGLNGVNTKPFEDCYPK